MSEHDLVKRQARVLLYMIALVHLACLGLMYRSAPDAVHLNSRYALRSVADTAGPSSPSRPRT